jgi:amino acid adenylation domain-containing protein
MVVALLGVLKAGAAYVPLDPAYPVERLSYMLEDAQVEVVLTEQELVERVLVGRIAGEGSREVIRIDEDWAEISGESRERIESAANSENLAYVIYTSGSTGQPKGVAIEHQSVGALIEWSKSVFSDDDLRGVLASTSICFDLSVFELFVTLSRGGCVIMADNALHLPELAAAGQVTLINTVPSLMAELVRMKSLPASVRVVNLAGEALRNELVQAVYEQGDVRAVWNLYGPSEDTTYSTYEHVLRGAQEEPGIGRPIGNTQAYVLDEQMQAVPIGVTGQLHVGGRGLARGYLNRAEMTAEKFIPNHLSGERGERLYRTGDLARYRADGRLEYLGRADGQVKVRGFRIELGEIETVLAGHGGVSEAVVVVREEPTGDKRLVAYVVGAQDSPATAAQLRGYVKGRLPDYMVPSLFIMLEKMPLTPNGKLDRRALPAPDEQRDATIQGQETARTPVEEVVAGIWAKVLGVEGVSVEANFFEVGGHSLLATQIVSRVRESFGVNLQLRNLFEAPTVAQMAARIEVMIKTSQGLETKRIERAPRGEYFDLSYAQQQLWVVSQLEPDNASYNIPRAVKFTGSLDVAALERAFNEVIRRHESLHTVFVTIDERPKQHVIEATTRHLPMVDLGMMPDGEREVELTELITAEAQRPFDLARGPLLRASLLRLGPQEHVILFNTHHIVSDGWSMEVLLREVTLMYEAFSKGEESPLEELPIQYGDFTEWQRTQSDEMDKQLIYWKQQLGGQLPVTKLRADRPRAAVRSDWGERLAFALPADSAQRIKALSQSEGATLFMTMLAAFDVLLSYYTTQNDIVVGTNTANRNGGETEGLIGFFANQLVLRQSLSDELTFRELLKRVRQVALDAYIHQDIPFDKVAATVQTEHGREGLPLFHIKFDLLQEAMATRQLSGVTISAMDIGVAAARYELHLMLTDSAEQLGGSWLYRSDSFSAAMISRMSEHYQSLLQHILVNPDARLIELTSALAEADRREQARVETEAQEAGARKFKNLLRRTKIEGELVEGR